MKRVQDTVTQGCNIKTQRERVLFKPKGEASEETNPTCRCLDLVLLATELLNK